MDNFSCLLSLRPEIVDPLWFNVDRPCDEEYEISLMEQEYVNELEAILKKDNDFIPLGKTASDNGDDVLNMLQPLEEIEEEEEEDNDDDDDSDSRGEDDEDDEMDVPYDPDSSPTTDNTPRIMPTEEP